MCDNLQWKWENSDDCIHSPRSKHKAKLKKR